MSTQVKIMLKIIFTRSKLLFSVNTQNTSFIQADNSQKGDTLWVYENASQSKKKG